MNERPCGMSNVPMHRAGTIGAEGVEEEVVVVVVVRDETDS